MIRNGSNTDGMPAAGCYKASKIPRVAVGFTHEQLAAINALVVQNKTSFAREVRNLIQKGLAA